MMRSVPFPRSLRDGRLTAMNDSKQILTADEITAAALPQWRHAEGALHVTYATGDFATGLALVDRIGEAAEAADHHPDLHLTYPTVSVTLTSHDAGGVTRRDVDMARRIDEFAAAAGVGTAEGACAARSAHPGPDRRRRTGQAPSVRTGVPCTGPGRGGRGTSHAGQRAAHRSRGGPGTVVAHGRVPSHRAAGVGGGVGPGGAGRRWAPPLPRGAPRGRSPDRDPAVLADRGLRRR